jgi:uncharacterized short protein YbdD (DUF466 family)
MTTRTAPATRPSLRGAVRAVAWYVREVVGENDYDKYVAHLSRNHPGAVPVTRREFERARTDRMESSPRSRCC